MCCNAISPERRPTTRQHPSSRQSSQDRTEEVARGRSCTSSHVEPGTRRSHWLVGRVAVGSLGRVWAAHDVRRGSRCIYAASGAYTQVGAYTYPTPRRYARPRVLRERERVRIPIRRALGAYTTQEKSALQEVCVTRGLCIREIVRLRERWVHIRSGCVYAGGCVYASAACAYAAGQRVRIRTRVRIRG